MNKKSTLNQSNNYQKVKWLLVDIGEVLLLKDGGKSFSELLANELGVDIELAKEINRAHYTTMDVKYIPEEEFVASLRKDLGYDAPEGIFSYFSRAYAKQVRPNVRLLNFLDEMRDIGVKTAILSNTIAIYSEIQERSGIGRKNGFDPILYSWEVEMLKPNRDIFELAISRLGSRPHEIIFIDDKTEHLQGAQSVGIRTVLFDDTENAISQIRKLCLSDKTGSVNEDE